MGRGIVYRTVQDRGRDIRRGIVIGVRGRGQGYGIGVGSQVLGIFGKKKQYGKKVSHRRSRDMRNGIQVMDTSRELRGM